MGIKNKRPSKHPSENTQEKFYNQDSGSTSDFESSLDFTYTAQIRLRLEEQKNVIGYEFLSSSLLILLYGWFDSVFIVLIEE
jgi:hypothetical protein